MKMLYEKPTADFLLPLDTDIVAVSAVGGNDPAVPDIEWD